jgi:SAM-dependent methyltransferase
LRFVEVTFRFMEVFVRDPTSPASKVDWSVYLNEPHPARRYNYWLGGKDNYAADRESGDQVAEAFPTIRQAAQENRKFLRRTVKFLVGEAGIRQILDIGAGLPTFDNTHQIAQRIAPQARVVYVDNDPMVMAHARALLTSGPQGRTGYLERDLRQPASILGDPELHATLDLAEPVALLLVAVMHFIADEDDPHGIVARLVDVLAAGSYLVMSHVTGDLMRRQLLAETKAGKFGPFWPRSREQFAGFFTGLELVPPGVVSIGHWRPRPGTSPPHPADIATYGAVARIP